MQAALEQAIPVHGVLRAPDALAPQPSLAQGNQATKQIILIGDGQSVGWQTDDPKAGGFWTRPSRICPPPHIFVRVLVLPQGIRNLTLKDVAFRDR